MACPRGFFCSQVSLERPADDTAGLLNYLHVEQADIFGFSNGGTIELQVAILQPRLVSKLVIASGFFNHDGAEAAFWAGFQQAQLGEMPKEPAFLVSEGDNRHCTHRAGMRLPSEFRSDWR